MKKKEKKKRRPVATSPLHHSWPARPSRPCVDRTKGNKPRYHADNVIFAFSVLAALRLLFLS